MFDVGPHKGLAHGYDRLAAEESRTRLAPRLAISRTRLRPTPP